MWRHGGVFGVIIFTLVMLSSPAFGLLSCITVSNPNPSTNPPNPCPAGNPVEVLELSPAGTGTGGFHAALPGQNWGSYSVCCGNVQYLGNTCTGTEGTNFDYVVFLSGQSNAHAEWVNSPPPAGPSLPLGFSTSNAACISVNQGATAVSCELPSSGPCSPGKVCVVTISSQQTGTNHLKPCENTVGTYSGIPYTNKICCSASGDTTPPVLTYNQFPATAPNPPILVASQLPFTIGVDSNEPLASCTLRLSWSGIPGFSFTNQDFTMTVSGQTSQTCQITSNDIMTALNFPGVQIVDGVYTYEARGSDGINTGYAGQRMLTVRVHPPTSQITNPQTYDPTGTGAVVILPNGQIQGFYNQNTWPTCTHPTYGLVSCFRGDATDNEPVTGGVRDVQVSLNYLNPQGTGGLCFHNNGGGLTVPVPSGDFPIIPDCALSVQAPPPPGLPAGLGFTNNPLPQPTVQWGLALGLPGAFPSLPGRYIMRSAAVDLNDFNNLDQAESGKVTAIFDNVAPIVCYSTNILPIPSNCATTGPIPQYIVSTPSSFIGILVTDQYPGIRKLEVRRRAPSGTFGQWTDISSSVTVAPPFPWPPFTLLGQANQFDYRIQNIQPPLNTGDIVQFRATDYSGNTGTGPELQILIQGNNPFTIITAPLSGIYNRQQWENANPIAGTAHAQSQNTVGQVHVIIKRMDNGKYWNGQTGLWVANEVSNPAVPVDGAFNSPTESWRFPGTPALLSTYYPTDPSIFPYLPGQFQIIARTTDNTGITGTAQVTVTFDPYIPLGWMTASGYTHPAPLWVNTQYFLVTWNGTDLETGIASLQVEWNDTFVNPQGNTVQTPWETLTQTLGNGTANFGPGQNDHTYSFRVISRDFANNVNQSDVVNVSVDLEAPLITLSSVTPFLNFLYAGVTIPLILIMNIDYVEDESGMGQRNLWLKPINPAGPEIDLLQLDLSSPLNNVYACTYLSFSPTHTSVGCAIIPDGTYEIKAGGQDVAGNIGQNTPVENVTVDRTAPLAGEIISPASDFVNTRKFNLSWLVMDGPSLTPSGIDYAHVQYGTGAAPPTTWQDIVQGSGPINFQLPPSFTWFDFGLGTNGGPQQASMTDGQKFWFRVQGVDIVGWVGAWGPVTITGTFQPKTIILDLTPPTVDDLRAEYGSPPTQIQGHNLPSPGTAATIDLISFNAHDQPPQPPNPGPGPASGLASHRLTVQWTQNGIFQHTEDCGVAPNCQYSFPNSGADEVVFWSTVRDRAGNEFQTSPPYILANHPLANFVDGSLQLHLGTAATADVQIRNLDSSPKDITLTLADYELAGFVGGSGDFWNSPLLSSSSALPTCPAGGISSDGRTAIICQLQAGGRGLLHVQVFASDTSNSGQFLRLSANGGEDSDELRITIGYPPGFSGLNDWTVLLLIGVSLLIFYLRNGPRKS